MSTMDTGSTTGTRTRDLDTAWTGWIGFAAIMLALIGSITFFEGLVAIFRDEYYVVTGEQVLLVFDLTTWGWIMLFWGIILFIAGLGSRGQVRLGAVVHDHRRLPEPDRAARLPGQHGSTRSGRSSSSASRSSCSSR